MLQGASIGHVVFFINLNYPTSWQSKPFSTCSIFFLAPKNVGIAVEIVFLHVYCFVFEIISRRQPFCNPNGGKGNYEFSGNIDFGF